MQNTADIEQEQPAHDHFATPSVGGRNDADFFDAIPGERVAIRVHGAQVAGRFSIVESVAAPDTSAPLHSHVEEEVFYVISGNPTFRLGGVIFETAPGSSVVIPANMPHAWINQTQSETRMIAIFAPGGIENLFPRLNGLPPEQVASLAAQFGTIVLGPPMQL